MQVAIKRAVRQTSLQRQEMLLLRDGTSIKNLQLQKRGRNR